MDDPPKKPRRKKREVVLHCSFCNKSQHEVRKLIAGPKALICDECIDLCNEIVEESELEHAKASRENLARFIAKQQKALDSTRMLMLKAVRETAGEIAPGSKTRH